MLSDLAYLSAIWSDYTNFLFGNICFYKFFNHLDNKINFTIVVLRLVLADLLVYFFIHERASRIDENQWTLNDISLIFSFFSLFVSRKKVAEDSATY